MSAHGAACGDAGLVEGFSIDCSSRGSGASSGATAAQRCVRGPPAGKPYTCTNTRKKIFSYSKVINSNNIFSTLLVTCVTTHGIVIYTYDDV